jgi:hypothetical protein
MELLQNNSGAGISFGEERMSGGSGNASIRYAISLVER